MPTFIHTSLDKFYLYHRSVHIYVDLTLVFDHSVVFAERECMGFNLEEITIFQFRIIPCFNCPK